MELKEFVTEALIAIIQGVIEAQSRLGGDGRYVNPQLSTQQGSLEKQNQFVSIRGQLVQTVNFDVAVTVASSTGTKGGIGVVAGIVALGSQGQSAAENSSVSRIKFSVPLTLPYGEKMHA